MQTISISNLRKLYGPIAAVDGFSLEIPGGIVFGLLGPNGAGKTTTFKCLLGLARATSGTILYDGKPLEPVTFERISYVPERSVLYDWMTVAEHVEMNRRAFTAFSPARAYELLDLFNIGRSRRVGVLSKGMKTAVMVALAFARNAEMLILDEPTSGLDPINQRHVLSLMINEAAKGNSVLFSSHQIGQVERAAEQIAVMDRGRLVLYGLVDDLKGDRKIVEGIFPRRSLCARWNRRRSARCTRRSHRADRSSSRHGWRRRHRVAPHGLRRDGGSRHRPQPGGYLPLCGLARNRYNGYRGKGKLVMNYIEWLRVRNCLRAVAIVLGVCLLLAVVLRISLSRYMMSDAWIQHMTLDPGTKVSHTTSSGWYEAHDSGRLERTDARHHRRPRICRQTHRHNRADESRSQGTKRRSSRQHSRRGVA